MNKLKIMGVHISGEKDKHWGTDGYCFWRPAVAHMFTHCVLKHRPFTGTKHDETVNGRNR